MSEFKWELICQSKYSMTYRAKVPTGWIINNVSWYEKDGKYLMMSESMTRVEDPAHKWQVDKE